MVPDQLKGMEILMRGFVFAYVYTVASAISTPEWVCEAPQYSNGPLPPILPDSYHMTFEVNDLIGAKRHTNEVW